MLIRLSILIVFMTGTACKKDKRQNPIPYVPVNITLYASDPEFFPLNTPGGWIYMTGGSRGLIIYRRSNDEFAAYDRHCTYNVNSSCGLLHVNNSLLTAEDSCCGSVFQLYDGSVTKGPAEYPMAAYNAVWNGNLLTVQN